MSLRLGSKVPRFIPLPLSYSTPLSLSLFLSRGEESSESFLGKMIGSLGFQSRELVR